MKIVLGLACLGAFIGLACLGAFIMAMRAIGAKLDQWDNDYYNRRRAEENSDEEI
jgi:hypothetical protein